VLLSPLDSDSIDDWRRDACRAMGDVVGGDCRYFLSAPLTGVESLWDDGLPEPLRAAYSVNFAQDEGTNRALRARVTAYNQTAIVAGDWAGYHRDPFVNELFLPYGVHDSIGLLTQVEAEAPTDERWCRFQLGAVRAPYGTERFGDTGLAMMRLLAPAFEAGVATLLAAGAWRESLGATLDALVTPAWVFSARADIVKHRNASAAYLLTEEPEAALVEESVAGLAQGLARSAEHSKTTRDPIGSVQATSTVRTASATYLLRGSHVTAARLGPSRTILVVARRTSAKVPDKAALRDRYGLTPRELDVAALIFDGLPTADIARRLSISVHTARRHVEQLLKKLGVHSRGVAQRLLRESCERPHGA
jgi:DNA-binding CsgD family transcriptional regulator